MLLIEVFVPLGMLGMLSLSGTQDFRMNMVAGAFWLLLSPTLMHYGLMFGAAGALVGLIHLGLFTRSIKRNDRYRSKFEIDLFRMMRCLRV